MQVVYILIQLIFYIIDNELRICGNPPESSYSIFEFVLTVLAHMANYMVRMMRHKDNSGLVDPIKAIEVQQALLQVQKTDIDKMPHFMIEKDLLSCAMKEGIIKTDLVSELKSVTKSFREAFSND